MKCKFCNEMCVESFYTEISLDKTFYCGNHDKMIIMFWDNPTFSDLTFFVDEYEFSCTTTTEGSYTVLHRHNVESTPTYKVYNGIPLDDLLHKSLGFELHKNLPKQVALVDYDLNLTPDNVRYYIKKLLKISVFS